MDVDLFDSTYRHLVLWNGERSEVVGAYRMGDTRAIIERFGRKGLYTHSLFRFKTGMLRYLADSLELGRSFIRSEYQRQPNCLALLWKGIGAYLVRHPGIAFFSGRSASATATTGFPSTSWSNFSATTVPPKNSATM